MDVRENNICRGCLCYDREMLPISDFTKKNIFSQLCAEFKVNILQLT